MLFRSDFYGYRERHIEAEMKKESNLRETKRSREIPRPPFFRGDGGIFSGKLDLGSENFSPSFIPFIIAL